MSRVDDEFKNILQTEWNYHFEGLQKKAMVMSYYKYGKMTQNHKVDNLMDAVANLEKRLEMYKETGNTEFLVDVANFAMIEFTYPQHPDAHFKGTDGKNVELIGFGINQIKNDIEK